MSKSTLFVIVPRSDMWHAENYKEAWMENMLAGSDSLSPKSLSMYFRNHVLIKDSREKALVPWTSGSNMFD